MPKRKNKVKVQSYDSQDHLDNASVVSLTSDDSEHPISSTDAEDEASIQSMLDKVCIAIESLDAKRSETRAMALRALISYFQQRYFGLDETWSYIDTFLGAVENILRRGKLSDQVLSSSLLSVFCLQCNTCDLVVYYSRFLTILEPIIRDPSAQHDLRSAAVTTVALFQSFSGYTEFINPLQLMKSLESVFKNAGIKRDGRARVFTPQVNALHVSALRGWTLIYTFLSPLDSETVGKDLILLVTTLLQSSDVDLRIAAGVTSAVIYERIRESSGSKFKGPHYADLADVLESLSIDGSKILSKSERKKQRHSFRDLYEFIVHHELPESSITLGQETLILSSYVELFRYDFFCTLLSNGFMHHLCENIQLRDIFDLGLPVFNNLTGLDRRVIRDRKKIANVLASKTRTQYLSAFRDKRSVVIDDSN